MEIELTDLNEHRPWKDPSHPSGSALRNDRRIHVIGKNVARKENNNNAQSCLIFLLPFERRAGNLASVLFALTPSDAAESLQKSGAPVDSGPTRCHSIAL
jgi:hypothetical protein